MTKFVLFYRGGNMPETPEEQAQIMQAWNGWFGQLGSGLVDGGQPFTAGPKQVAADGTVSEGDGGAGGSGYSIIEAESLDAAVALAQACPVLQGGATIAVYETFPVMM